MYVAHGDKTKLFGPSMLRIGIVCLLKQRERRASSGPAKERVRSGQWSQSLGIMGGEEKTSRLSSQAKKEKSFRRTRSVLELE
jgi:hypothetical protein